MERHEQSEIDKNIHRERERERDWSVEGEEQSEMERHEQSEIDKNIHRERERERERLISRGRRIK